MLDFLKKIFNNKNKDLTFVLFDDDEPESSNSYHFRPVRLWQFLYGVIALAVVITVLLVIFTPVGSLMYNKEDAQLRDRVIAISKSVASLQDSLQARNTQLKQMRNAIATDAETTFAVSSNPTQPTNKDQTKNRELKLFSAVNSTGDFDENEILFSNIFQNAPVFPTDYPIDGTFTRGYNPSNGHYGIDIAIKQGTPFRAVADGAIINQVWSLNYGFVVQVQHSNGIITIYKHASSLTKSIGDIVMKGDVLGTAGDAGILSSGPHLHFEIWKNGIPQNPNMYLIKP